MSTEEIIKTNKMIAIFMGAKFKGETQIMIDLSPDDLWLPYHGVKKYTRIDIGAGPILKYHSSYDWIVPVINRIGDVTGNELVINSETSYWNNFGDNALDKEFLGYAYPIEEGFYPAVSEIIEWYNENKS
jgi:hypothetical protein